MIWSLESWRGGIRALKYIVETQGFLGLYRGHTLTLARAIPHAAIGYTLYEYARKVSRRCILQDYVGSTEFLAYNAH